LDNIITIQIGAAVAEDVGLANEMSIAVAGRKRLH